MKKNATNKSMGVLALLTIAVLVLSACQPAGEATPSADEIALSVASTQQANATAMSIQTLVAKVEELSNQPTWTPQPTYTPYPLPTVSAPTAALGEGGTPLAPTAAPIVSGQKCYQMEFWGDVNYPPDSVVTPGKTFTKIWKVKNTGTCTWGVDFDVVFIGGDRIGGNGDLKWEVKPGDVVELSVPIVAPSAEGTYMAYWMLQDTYGARFGYGNDYSLAVRIQVGK